MNGFESRPQASEGGGTSTRIANGDVTIDVDSIAGITTSQRAKRNPLQDSSCHLTVRNQNLAHCGKREKGRKCIKGRTKQAAHYQNHHKETTGTLVGFCGTTEWQGRGDCQGPRPLSGS